MNGYHNLLYGKTPLNKKGLNWVSADFCLPSLPEEAIAFSAGACPFRYSTTTMSVLSDNLMRRV